MNHHHSSPDFTRLARECVAAGDYATAITLPSPASLAQALARFVSTDPRIATLKREVSFIARFTAESEMNCFIHGETGTGKELIAAALGSVSSGRFVAINCAALPHDLIESELFGHRKGAFTGADEDKPGLIQAAQNGTVFLDEIGDMPLAAQAKLLRVLSTRRIRRVGDTADQPFTINCRFIGATHRDLRILIEAGAFREDLYWRLAQWTFTIPPLRERRDDILPIIHTVPDWDILSDEVIATLSAQHFSGNVRELLALTTQAILREKLTRYDSAKAAHDAAKATHKRI